MALSVDLISQFAKIASAKDEEKKSTTVYGTIVEYDGRKYVKIDGSEILTPVNETINTVDEDRVSVEIKNHTATVMGNVTSPSAVNRDVVDLGDKTFLEINAINGNIDNLEAGYAKIGSLEADNATIRELIADEVTARKLDVDTLTATAATIDGKLTAVEADIETLTADKADVKVLNAVSGTVQSLVAENATITGRLDANEADIEDLDAKKLSAEDAALEYANIDFANIGEAAVNKFYAVSGIIKDLTLETGVVVKELVGVTIKGDLIQGNTIAADKLVVLGDDGLYYKLNVNALGEATASSDEKYQNGLAGDALIANSVTAEKISVDDLVAFDATIGGFHIGDHSIYSGAKASATNTTRGIFLGDDGQIAFGDSDNFIKFFKDTDDRYKLSISADNLKFATSGKTVEEAISDVQTDVDEVQTNLIKAIEDQHSIIEQTKTSITSEVYATYVTKNDLSKSVEDIYTDVNQTKDDLTIEIGHRITDISDLSGSVSQQFEQLNTYFEFAEAGLTIGKSSSQFKVMISNDNISFKQGSKTLGWWDGNFFHTGNIDIDVSEIARFGNFAYVPRSDGSLMLLKIK